MHPVTSASVCDQRAPLEAPPAKTTSPISIPVNSFIFSKFIADTIHAFSCKALNIEALLQISGSIERFKKLGAAWYHFPYFIVSEKIGMIP